ncbi:MAG: helix-turn-helix transcriptional regulator [Nitrospirota bacterium]|nr:helix-turn-helix transcriptional regulator [Nitrospirota bacterium]
MKKKEKFEKSSGNVFADLGLEDSEELRLKAELGAEIFRILNRRKLTQADAAELLGIDQPQVSRLKNGEFNRFSVSRLFSFLNRLNRKVEVRVSRYRRGDSYQEVHVSV